MPRRWQGLSPSWEITLRVLGVGEHIRNGFAFEEVLFDEQRDFPRLHPVIPNLLLGSTLKNHQHRSIPTLPQATRLLNRDLLSQSLGSNFLLKGFKDLGTSIAAAGTILTSKDLNRIWHGLRDEDKPNLAYSVPWMEFKKAQILVTNFLED